MALGSTAALIDALVKYDLLTAEQLQEAMQHMKRRFNDPQTMARAMIQRNWLTPYQVNHLLQGHAKDLVLGAYLLLERLGEGGMGSVYKAKHKKLDRVVALKLIRRDLVASPEAIQRFRQEIETAAQLSHPNIVLAYDADEIDGTHFYTMEYVEGTTLGHLVRRSGPMSVTLACDYIRQAAQGLQHAHERGLVHRDIKPSNLMLTWTSKTIDPTGGAAADARIQALWGSHMPLIKILDMGLARGHLPEAGKEYDGSITEKGTLMGTPDYISPEQAVNAHKVDIRADLYSLGATLYSLITATVPFPGGGTMEKVIRAQLEVPTPMAQLRPGVPAEVQAIVSKLMAKKPDDRYQTPAELAKVLMVYLTQSERGTAKR
ncbi:MAG: serine/threonine protein kinase [Planctomycetia bacterium]|nr:serine/threonine protein kinase [Planctomycetia bacterium]